MDQNDGSKAIPADFRQGYEAGIKTPQFSSSSGRRRRKNGFKGEGGVNHMMSDLESEYSECLDFAPLVINYREQYALPIDETLEIASSLGTCHPRKKNKITKKMEYVKSTIDFYIHISIGDREFYVARDVKRSEELEKERTVMLLEIKRIYCRLHDIDYGIVTPVEIMDDLAKNIRSLSRDRKTGDLGVSSETIGSIIEYLAPEIEKQEQPLNTLTSLCDHHHGLSVGTSLKVVKHLIINEIWIVNLFNPFDPHQPLIVIEDKTAVSGESLNDLPNNS